MRIGKLAVTLATFVSSRANAIEKFATALIWGLLRDDSADRRAKDHGRDRH